MRGGISVGVIMLFTALTGVAAADSTEATHPLSLSDLIRNRLARAPLRSVAASPVAPDRADPALSKLDGLRTSIVARDWRGAFAISGDPSLLPDSFRLSRSSRMIVGRVALGHWRIVPYAHVGFGQWRTDRDVLPLMPQNQELATQLSGGIEMHLFEQTRVAWESDYTILCREKREPQNLPTPRVLGTFAVLETRF